jgi:hypothetical protein
MLVTLFYILISFLVAMLLARIPGRGTVRLGVWPMLITLAIGGATLGIVGFGVACLGLVLVLLLARLASSRPVLRTVAWVLVGLFLAVQLIHLPIRLHLDQPQLLIIGNVLSLLICVSFFVASHELKHGQPDDDAEATPGPEPEG